MSMPEHESAGWKKGAESGGVWQVCGLLVAGLLATALAAHYVKSNTDAVAKREFDLVCNEIQTKIVDRLDAHAQILRSGAAFYENADRVDRAKWRRYTERQNVAQHLPGIQGFGFVLLIPREQLAEHVREIRAEGFPEYSVHPEGDREVYSSIIYLEPFAGRNLRAFGYDMLSEPVRREAMERARDLDSAALTGKVLLVQETDEDIQAGTLMYVPVYRRGMPSTTLEQRRAALMGWVYSPYRMGDLMERILGERNLASDRGIRLEVFDGEQTNQETLLFDSQSADANQVGAVPGMTAQSGFVAAGQQWILRFTLMDSQEAGINYPNVWLLALGGVAISLLLSGLLFSLFRIRITSRKLVQFYLDRAVAAEALRESEEKYRGLFNESIATVYLFDERKNFLDSNQAGLDLLGYSREDLLRMNASDVDADPIAVVGAYEQLLSGERIIDFEHGLRRKTGEVIVVLNNSRPLVNVDGQVFGIQSTLIDITARKQAEEALHDSEQRLRSYFNSPTIGIAITSPGKGWLETNARLCAMLGYSMEELQGGMTWAELTHPDDLAADVAQFERLLAGEIDDYSMDKRFIRKSGEIIWTRLGVGCVRKSDGFVDYTVATLEDITERKQAEAERERLMAAIEQVAECIVITDAEGAIQYVNPFFEQATGYTCEEAIGQNPRILKSGTHDDAFYKEMWDTLRRGEVWTGRIVNKKKDGTLYTEEATISPVRDASGKTVNYVAVNRDVTHEIALTAQLRQAQKMDAVGQLAGGIAHDFNNLLQAILGHGEMVLYDAGTESLVRASVEEMMKAGYRAKTVVGQLLAFSRQQVLELKDVNLNDSIADVMKMLCRVIGEHITLDVISSHDLGIVRADPGQIDQILMNLCVNARDAMGESGKITIETENVRIDDEFCEVRPWARPGRYVLLSVTDTGCGMDQETLGKVFEPFFTTKDVGKGTGLGLATVYGLVKQHQGFVHVYSEVDKGTTFKIYLPLAERSAAVVSDKIDGPAPDGTETILLAEDNETLLKLTKHFLELAGYTVLSAIDGEDALRVFEEHADEIDMALLDVMMPNLGGKAVYKRIRETRPDLPFLFASGYSMGSLHDNFVLDEGLHLVQKPYRRVDLLRKVREVLDRSSAAPNGNGDRV